jgi:uncharacterized protein
MMGKASFDGYDGMVFEFSGDTKTPFYMKGTPLALSIAWFAADGTFIAARDMTPCLEAVRCPTYAPGPAYRYALEVPRGTLGSLGVGAGSVLELGAACGSST